ncbi:MAG: hypothetical protein AB7H80_02190 [Candidatus Kapaibacterium sp.]
MTTTHRGTSFVVIFLPLFLFMISATATIAQPTTDPQGDVGIGTAVPDASAIQDISSTSKGVLIPRMTTAQRNAIPAPAHGLLVFNSEDNEFQHYDMNVAAWVSLLSNTSAPFVLSYSTINNGGTIPTDAVVINVQSTGADAVTPSVTLPASGTNGQVLWVTTNDPDGATVSGFSFATNSSVRYVYAAGAWRREF